MKYEVTTCDVETVKCGEDVRVRVDKRCGDCAWPVRSIVEAAWYSCDGTKCESQLMTDTCEGFHCVTVPGLCSGTYRLCLVATIPPACHNDQEIQIRKVVKDVRVNNAEIATLQQPAMS